MDLRLVTPPTGEPVGLAEVQEHLKALLSDSEAALVATYIEGAREIVEGITGRVLMPQTWQLRLDEWPDAGRGHIVLPLSPVRSITEIAYTNDAGASVVMPSADYQAKLPSSPYAQGATIAPAAGTYWPSAAAGTFGAVRITFAAGYASQAAVPSALKTAILLIVADMYENRQASEARRYEDVPGVSRYLTPFMVFNP